MGHTPRLLAILACVCAALAAATLDPPKTVDVFAWPLSATKSQPFATISYAYPRLNATVVSYTPLALTAAGSNDLVRIGFYRSADTWSGISASPQSFGPDRLKKLRVIVDADGNVFHVALSSTPNTPLPIAKKSKKTADTKVQDELLVEVVRQTPGPQPHLNKPIVVSAEGKVEGDEKEEKSFIQKYWWAIGLFLVLQVVMGGAGGDK